LLSGLINGNLPYPLKNVVLNIGKQTPAPHLHLDNYLLPVVPLADLGVLVSSSLCPSAHINDIVAKALNGLFRHLKKFSRFDYLHSIHD